MSLNDQKFASFFIRVWQEPREEKDAPPVWRGSIEHVQTGHKRYFKDVDIPISFVRDLLDEIQTPQEYAPFIR